MIYDCFPFFNELEALDIRLHELDKVVDRFVLVEANLTHQEKPKPLYYNENKEKFSEFKDKIIHVIVENMPKGGGAFDRGNFQPRQIMRGLKDCTPNDLIMSSDADEIPRASVVQKMVPGQCYGLSTKEFHYWVNCATNISYATTGVCPYNSGLDTLSLRQTHGGGQIIENAGWHFTYMAPAERIIQKLASFTHGDYLGWTPERLKECIEKNPPCDIQGGAYGRRMEIIPFDDNFPKYLLDNLSKFRHIIHPSVQI